MIRDPVEMELYILCRLSIHILFLWSDLSQTTLPSIASNKRVPLLAIQQSLDDSGKPIDTLNQLLIIFPHNT